MRQITSAILSSFINDLASRRGKILLIGIAIVIVIACLLLWCKDQPLPTERATLSELSVTDNKAVKWTLELVKGQPLSRINNSNKKPGPPLLVKTNVRKISNQQLSIGITVEGQAGEKYIAGAIKNGMREPEPQFIIINERSKILARGQFEYG